MNYLTEAETCRREALQHLGKPEASFLLRLAVPSMNSTAARAMRRNDTAKTRLERDRAPTANCAMSDGVQKLRALAKQSRVMSRQAVDRERARTLRLLAELYDRQAADLEATEPAIPLLAC